MENMEHAIIDRNIDMLVPGMLLNIKFPGLEDGDFFFENEFEEGYNQLSEEDKKEIDELKYSQMETTKIIPCIITKVHKENENHYYDAIIFTRNKIGEFVATELKNFDLLSFIAPDDSSNEGVPPKWLVTLLLLKREENNEIFENYGIKLSDIFFTLRHEDNNKAFKVTLDNFELNAEEVEEGMTETSEETEDNN